MNEMDDFVKMNETEKQLLEKSLIEKYSGELKENNI